MAGSRNSWFSGGEPARSVPALHPGTMQARLRHRHEFLEECEIIGSTGLFRGGIFDFNQGERSSSAELNYEFNIFIPGAMPPRGGSGRNPYFVTSPHADAWGYLEAAAGAAAIAPEIVVGHALSG